MLRHRPIHREPIISKLEREKRNKVTETNTALKMLKLLGRVEDITRIYPEFTDFLSTSLQSIQKGRDGKLEYYVVNQSTGLFVGKIETQPSAHDGKHTCYEVTLLGNTSESNRAFTLDLYNIRFYREATIYTGSGSIHFENDSNIMTFDSKGVTFIPVSSSEIASADSAE